MAFTVDSVASDGNIEVIIRADTALDVTDEEYEAYLDGLDESKLKFKEGDTPCRWVLKKSIPYRLQQKIENHKVRYEKGELQIQMSFIAEEVRATLLELKYDDSFPIDKRFKIKHDGEGMVMEDVMGKLNQAGVTMNLYRARNAYLERMKAGSSSLKKG